MNANPSPYFHTYRILSRAHWLLNQGSRVGLIFQTDRSKTNGGTIDGVDHQLQELYLLAEGNQHYVVRYLSGTRVVAQGRDYPATSLRAGDRVEVELHEGTDRRLYADQVRVIGTGGAPAATRMRDVEGTVERISLDRGMLELRARNGELLTIYVPESSSAETRDRFHRLWVGDYVRLAGESLSENRIELLAFR